MGSRHEREFEKYGEPCADGNEPDALEFNHDKDVADLALGERVNPSDVKDLDAQLGEMASLANEILAELKAAADAR